MGEFFKGWREAFARYASAFLHLRCTWIWLGIASLLVLALCFVILEQTTNDVILVNETALPVTVEEVFIGDKIANEKMEPYGFEYVHTVDSDVLRDYILEPNERTRRRFSVSRWRLFRVAFVTPEGKSTWCETNARAWGNRMSIEFTESTHREGGVLKSKASLLRNWFEQAQDSIPFISRWLD